MKQCELNQQPFICHVEFIFRSYEEVLNFDPGQDPVGTFDLERVYRKCLGSVEEICPRQQKRCRLRCDNCGVPYGLTCDGNICLPCNHSGTPVSSSSDDLVSSSSNEKLDEDDNDDLSIYSLVIDDETQKDIEAISRRISDDCSTGIESLTINKQVGESDADHFKIHVSFETPEAIKTVIETPINVAFTTGFLRDMPNDIINEQCQFCKINGKLYSSFTKDTAFTDSGNSYVMDPSMKGLQNATRINEDVEG